MLVKGGFLEWDHADWQFPDMVRNLWKLYAYLRFVAWDPG